MISSCQRGMEWEEVVYCNDFEGGDLAGIEGGALSTFETIAVLGNYNKGGFSLSLEDLPQHDLLAISFDLYVHDSWDGNAALPDGPDRWYMELDEKKIIDVTFSNNQCVSTYCLLQSYPDPFPTFNDPRTGSVGALAGLCHWSGQSTGTSRYQITRTIAHSGSRATFRFRDQLVQTNAGPPKCDESWSMGMLEVTALVY